jgi:hypothetical protein
MTTGKQSQGWFEQLRRDGGLFALVCALILVANLLQPMAQARADGADEAWTICTTHGLSQAAAPADPGNGPEHPHDCCIAGNHCGGLSAPKLFVSAEPAFAPPGVSLEPLRGTASAVDPGGLPADPPPAIRAPPLFA